MEWKLIDTAPMKKEVLVFVKSTSGSYPDDWSVDMAERLSQNMFLGEKYLYSRQTHKIYWMPVPELPKEE